MSDQDFFYTENKFTLTACPPDTLLNLIQANSVFQCLHLQSHFVGSHSVLSTDDDDSLQFDVAREGNVEEELLVSVRDHELKGKVLCMKL